MVIARRILAFIAAVVVAEVTIAVVNAHSVMARLAELGVEIPFGTRLATYGQDVLGIAGTFVPVLLAGFAIAFTVAWAVVRWLLPGWRAVGYPLAGAACLAVVLVALEQIFLTHPVAVSRSLLGTLLVVACGALGGWVFVLLLPEPGNDESLERSPA
jgi:hypothetical protein